jgi:hypothetical protein
MLTKKLLFYGSMATLLASVGGCSAIEYVGQKKNYTYSASYLTSSPISAERFNKEAGESVNSAAFNASALSDKRNNSYAPSFYSRSRLSLLSVTKSSSDKGSSRKLGSIYLHSGLSNTANSDLVFNLSYDRSGYKATTPLFYHSDTTDTGLVLKLDRRRHLSAGIECTINLDLFK